MAAPAPASLRNSLRVSPASDIALDIVSVTTRYAVQHQRHFPRRGPYTCGSRLVSRRRVTSGEQMWPLGDRVMTVQQNDPGELLEVFDAHGNPTGRARTRAAVHLDGDWHQAFHCWILRHNRDEIVLQRRSFAKDTFAGCWDAAAAGHWRFGETAAEAAREIAEELGLQVNFAELVYRGREAGVRRFANGLIDREHHQVYVLESDRPLAEYRPDPSEVIGLAAFAAHDLLALSAGRSAEMRATEAVLVRPDATLSPNEVVVHRDELVPYSAARLRRMLGMPSSSPLLH
jgi:isopentenyldiphosphate isomerase